MDNSGNGAELDEQGLDYDDPQLDEFEELAFAILAAVNPGKRSYRNYLTVDYRDFPATITDAETGAAVYPEPGSPANSGTTNKEATS